MEILYIENKTKMVGINKVNYKPSTQGGSSNKPLPLNATIIRGLKFQMVTKNKKGMSKYVKES
jgi:hypothetical protein